MLKKLDLTDKTIISKERPFIFARYKNEKERISVILISLHKDFIVSLI